MDAASTSSSFSRMSEEARKYTQMRRSRSYCSYSSSASFSVSSSYTSNHKRLPTFRLLFISSMRSCTWAILRLVSSRTALDSLRRSS